MLGLADRSRVLDLIDKIIAGDHKAALNEAHRAAGAGRRCARPDQGPDGRRRRSLARPGAEAMLMPSPARRTGRSGRRRWPTPVARAVLAHVAAAAAGLRGLRPRARSAGCSADGGAAAWPRPPACRRRKMRRRCLRAGPLCRRPKSQPEPARARRCARRSAAELAPPRRRSPRPRVASTTIIDGPRLSSLREIVAELEAQRRDRPALRDRALRPPRRNRLRPFPLHRRARRAVRPVAAHQALAGDDHAASNGKSHQSDDGAAESMAETRDRKDVEKLATPPRPIPRIAEALRRFPARRCCAWTSREAADELDEAGRSGANVIHVDFAPRDTRANDRDVRPRRAGSEDDD